MSKVLQLKMQLVTQVGMGAAVTGRDPGGTDLGFGGRHQHGRILGD